MRAKKARKSKNTEHTAGRVVKATKRIEKRLPFKITKLYFHNGSELLNEEMVREFIKSMPGHEIKIFRSRPYRKNDQCYVEQKSYTHLRKIMGYGRLDWKKAVNMMNNAYRKEWSIIQNLFSPQQQLMEKIRKGSKIRRWMSEAMTPLERLAGYIPEVDFQRLELAKEKANPFHLSCHRQYFFFYEQHSALLLGQDHIKLPTSGSVSLGSLLIVQFFGSSLAPNHYLQMMFLDGVFAIGKDGVKFFEPRGMSQESMFNVIGMIYLRLAKLFANKGYVYPSTIQRTVLEFLQIK